VSSPGHHAHNHKAGALCSVENTFRIRGDENLGYEQATFVH
jgi:hypothetical protein